MQLPALNNVVQLRHHAQIIPQTYLIKQKIKGNYIFMQSFISGNYLDQSLSNHVRPDEGSLQEVASGHMHIFGKGNHKLTTRFTK